MTNALPTKGALKTASSKVKNNDKNKFSPMKQNNENNNNFYGYNKSRTFSRQSTGRPEGNLIQLKMMEKIILPGDKVKYKCD